MGTYVYTVRAKNTNITFEDGSVEKAHLLSYSYKLRDAWLDREAYKAMVNKKESAAYRTVDNHRPEFVVLGDTFEEGNPVFLWNPWSIKWIDYNDLGTFLGYLKKVGRKWTVVRENPLAKKVDAA